MKQMQKSHGFSLIELMIVVAIIGILMAVAYPSYLEYIRETRRGVAQADLTELAQWMARQHAVDFDYRDGGGDPALPFTTSPRNGNSFYAITFVAGSVGQNTFTLQAAPTGDQAGDRCGTLTIDQTGNRGDENGNTCW